MPLGSNASQRKFNRVWWYNYGWHTATYIYYAVNHCRLCYIAYVIVYIQKVNEENEAMPEKSEWTGGMFDVAFGCLLHEHVFLSRIVGHGSAIRFDFFLIFLFLAAIKVHNKIVSLCLFCFAFLFRLLWWLVDCTMTIPIIRSTEYYSLLPTAVHVCTKCFGFFSSPANVSTLANWLYCIAKKHRITQNKQSENYRLPQRKKNRRLAASFLSSTYDSFRFGSIVCVVGAVRVPR